MKRFYNSSDFDLNLSNAPVFEAIFLKRVRFWLKSLTTRPILDWKKNALYFEFKFFKKSVFGKMFACKKSRFGSFYSVKLTYFAFFVIFYKSWFWVECFITCQILTWKKYNASDYKFTLHRSCRWTLTSHSTSSKKKNEKVLFQKTTYISPANERYQTTEVTLK